MFNGFRLQQVEEQRGRVHRDQQRGREVRDKDRRKRKELAQNHEGRVNTFMMMVSHTQMLESPQEIATSDTPNGEKLLKGAPRMRMNGFPTERSRIQAELEKHQFLDVEPCFIKPSFRSSDPSKSIQPRMYFGPVDSLDRIRDVAKYPNIVRVYAAGAASSYLFSEARQRKNEKQ